MLDINLILLIFQQHLMASKLSANLDQSVKQSPSRHKIGPEAFSIYSQAADLGNGRIWYSILGIGAALLTVLDAINTFFLSGEKPHSISVYAAAILSIAHSIYYAKPI